MHKKYLFILPLLTAPFAEAALTTEEQLAALQGQMARLQTQTEEQAAELATLRAAQQPEEEAPVVTATTEPADLTAKEKLKREAVRIAGQLTDPETHEKAAKETARVVDQVEAEADRVAPKIEKEAKRIEKQVSNFFKK